MSRLKRNIVFILLGFLPGLNFAQFYNGFNQEFGKNRVQYDEFTWTHYDFDRFNIYFYTNGQNNAAYTAKVAPDIIAGLEEKFDYYLEEKIQFIIYNKFSHFKQSNIGINDDNQNDIGGITRIVDSKVFLYFNGDHNDLEKQIKAGVANLLINRMMLGRNWKEMLKNSTLLTIPGWYVDGLTSYLSDPWNPLIEDKIKDGVISGKYKQFNRLSGEDAVNAGHAIWYYIANTYGEKVIPNILYMSRLSRNVESGFLYVIGLSLNTLSKESNGYFQEFFREAVSNENFPDNPVDVPIRANRKYSQLKISPDGKHIAYVTNELGKYKVWLYNRDSHKSKSILTGGYKLDWITDHSGPLLEWHPDGSSLTIITEKKAQNYITFYMMDSGDKVTKPLLRLDKVINMAYAPDGKTMVLSATAKGQTDLYQYHVASNFQKQLTNDIFDDKDPAFLTSGKIIFSSNRIDDTLRISSSPEKVSDTYDLFTLNVFDNQNILKRVTNTPKINETQPYKQDSGQFVFLTDKSAICNRYKAHFDSVISHIDTAFHYRHITVSEPVTNYSRNILEHHFSGNTGEGVELLYKDKKYFLNINNPNEPNVGMGSTNDTKDRQVDNDDFLPDNNQIGNVLEYSVIRTPLDTVDKKIDYNNYVFEDEKNVETTNDIIEDKAFEKIADQAQTDSAGKSVVILPEDTQIEEIPFVLPKQLNYNLAFSSLDVQTQLNFNYTSDMYQRYTGQIGYMNTKIGTETSVKLVDLFNNYEITGGARASLDWSIKEYFISYNNRKNRLNKKYTFERQGNKFLVDYKKFHLIYNQVKIELKYPFSEVLSLKGTGNVRYDKMIELSTDEYSFAIPTATNTMGGLKMELVYDNTGNMGLNLLKGTRAKLFAETYNSLLVSESVSGVNGDSVIIGSNLNYKPDIIVLGFDIRKYIKVHREIIWANRLTASTSIGEGKLLYYLGGVDNKVHLTEANPRFNYDLPVSDKETFVYQTVATNMRGFLQNSRNGNSFALFNSELRIPVFRYFATKPLKSDFVKNFQTVLFTDIGTAWTGPNPYSDENYFNSTEIVDGNVKVILKNQYNPIIGSYGFGFRSRVLGYFMKLDFAWGVEDGKINKPRSYLSLGLDF